MLDTFLKLIYPPRCISCNNIIEINASNYFCNTCNENVKPIHSYTCIKCGIPVDTYNVICNHCKDKTFLFEKNFSVFIYDDIISTVIKNLKFNNFPGYSRNLGSIMSKYFKEKINIHIDYFVPVPLHKNKLKKRGFNQAELLSLEISKNIGIRTIKDLLIRQSDTKSQYSLGATQREINLKDAFIYNNKYNIGTKNIMIIDDIYTTGTTINSCANVLLKNGANIIYSFCLARA